MLMLQCSDDKGKTWINYQEYSQSDALSQLNYYRRMAPSSLWRLVDGSGRVFSG